MFVANVLTVWAEALKAVFNADNPTPEVQNLPVLTEYPLQQVHYPGLWINFAVQGDVKNVGIGHVEYTTDAAGNFHEVYRWEFGGLMEITAGAMGNLERALLIDEVTRTIAVARVDRNAEGILRQTVEQNDLVGMNVTWESMSVGGFAENVGTPWGTDDVIYEATITLDIEGEVILDPATAALVPLSSVIFEPQEDGDPLADPLPVVGVDGWT